MTRNGGFSAEKWAMDKLDREIIEALRVNARVSYKDLGESVFLSANAVSDRLRRLEEQGVVQGYEARNTADTLDRACPATTLYERPLPAMLSNAV
jgi:Lrp/AsnC family leucine-responsive transcriptional regulator